jgi:hypothetical protein
MFSYLQNHWMRDQIRKNTHRGILAVAEAGYWPVGTAPYGWRIVAAPDNAKRKTVVLDEAEAATIGKAVELVVDEGLSCWKAALDSTRSDTFRATAPAGTTSACAGC